MKKKFKYQTYQINNNDGVPLLDYATATFINKGTATININGLPLAPTESITDDAFGDEQNESQYSFIPTNAGTFIIFMRIKIYIK